MTVIRGNGYVQSMKIGLLYARDTRMENLGLRLILIP